MRLYLLYLLTALTNCYMLLLFWGFSAGLANYKPAVAVGGCAILFVVAAPVLVFNARMGLIIGCLCCISLLPYNIAFLTDIVKDKSYHTALGLTAMLPSVVNMVTLYLCIPTPARKYRPIKGRYARISWAILPVAIIVLYIAFLRG